MGNYKSFGDTKFIPGAPASAFEAALGASAAAKADKAAVDGLWKQVAGPLYDLAPRRRQFGLETGLSAYYSADITKKEIELVQRYGIGSPCCCLALSRLCAAGSWSLPTSRPTTRACSRLETTPLSCAWPLPRQAPTLATKTQSRLKVCSGWGLAAAVLNMSCGS